MIDFNSEHLISLRDAATELGRHVATLYRWTDDGLRGVVLETLQVGGSRCTSREALQRFFERLSTATLRKPERVGIGAEKAAAELEAYGV